VSYATARCGLRATCALPAIVLIANGHFASELFVLGVPGVWFPLDMGVSLANYAYPLAPIAIFALVVSRVRRGRSEALASA
jgi:hypothetical protein